MIHLRASEPQGLRLCQYELSRNLLRGVRRDLNKGYNVALGGDETFGKGMSQSYPELLENHGCGRWVNMGVRNAGPDVYLRDPVLLEMISKSDHGIVQVMGAGNMSNPYYRVHPRRNDRFIAPEPKLRRLFPEIDFTGFHYTRHLLGTLEFVDPIRFLEIQKILKREWVSKMKKLLSYFENPPTLLWISERQVDRLAHVAKAPDPVFIGRTMLNELHGWIATTDYLTSGSKNPFLAKDISERVQQRFKLPQ